MTDDEAEIPAPAIVRSGTRRERPDSVGRATRTTTATPAAAQKKIGNVETKLGATGKGGATLQPKEAMLIGCPTCGARISRRASRCPKCGAAPYRQCQICATQILANAAPCPECGDPQPFEAE